MKESYVYHGHSIELDLSEPARTRIRWTYFIDERYCMEGAMDSFSVEAVRTNALVLAHRSIDALDSMRPANSLAQASRGTGLCLVPTLMDHASQRVAAGPSPRSTK